MKRATAIIFSVAITVLGGGISGHVFSNPQHLGGNFGAYPMSHPVSGYGSHMAGQHMPSQHHGKPGGHGKHLLGTHWKKNLTEQQRSHIDQTHLAFTKANMLLKSEVKVLKVELAMLSIAEQPNMELIEKRIAQLLVLKRDLMRIRYEHIIEMRKILTPEQRTSFDLDILNNVKQRHPGRNQ